MRKITSNILQPAHNNMVLKNTIIFLEKTVNLPLVQEDGLLIIKHYEELQREKREVNDIIGVRVNRLLSILRTRILSVPRMSAGEKKPKTVQKRPNTVQKRPNTVQKRPNTVQISLIEREEAVSSKKRAYSEVVIVDD